MKILLMDAAFSAEPVYDALVRLGHEVWVIGSRDVDVLAAKADQRWLKLDYSKVEVVRDHLIRMGFDRVVPGCTDVSLETCVKLGKPWFHGDALETNFKLSDKAAFRQICAELDLPAPLVVSPDSFPRAGKYICKPVDAFSGRGISVFDGEDLGGLRSALALGSAESRSGHCVIETYCEGLLYSCSAFLNQGKIAHVFYVREGSSVNPYAVDTSYVDVEFGGEAKHQIENAVQRLAAHFNLTDGLLHTQFILGNGKPYIVELTRRCPGDLYSLLIEFSTGIPYAEIYADSFVDGSILEVSAQQRHVLRHTVTANSGGVYNGLRFIQPEPIQAFISLLPVGASLLPRQGNRAGVMFSAYLSKDEMVEAFERFMNRAAYAVV